MSLLICSISGGCITKHEFREQKKLNLIELVWNWYPTSGFIHTGTISTRLSSIDTASGLSERYDVLLLITEGVLMSCGNSNSKSTCWKWNTSSYSKNNAFSQRLYLLLKTGTYCHVFWLQTGFVLMTKSDTLSLVTTNNYDSVTELSTLEFTVIKLFSLL
jgi:hypothetical protein